MQRARIADRWNVRVFGALVTLTLCLLVTFFVQAQSPGPGTRDPAADAETAFVCPMHPDYTLDIAGSCPRCGMALVRGAPFDVRDYGLEPPLSRPSSSAANLRGGSSASLIPARANASSSSRPCTSGSFICSSSART